MMGSYTSSFHRGQVGNNIGRPPIGNVMTSSGYRPRGRTPMSIPPRSTPVQGIPILRSGIMVRHANASGANFPVSIHLSHYFIWKGVNLFIQGTSFKITFICCLQF